MNRNIGISAGFVAVIVVFIRALLPSGQVSGTAAAPAATDKKQAAAGKRQAKKKAAAGKRQATPATGAAAAANTVVVVTPPEDEYLEGPWLATQQFYGLPSDFSQPDDLPGDDDLFAIDKVQQCGRDSTCGPQLGQFFGIGDPSKVEFLLATVPDPLHSRLSLFTDSSIQAIEGAATQAGWRFAAQWLPWNDNIDPDEKDPKVRREQRADTRNQEKQPGVMVFRSPTSAQVLVVFLAGETPTGGINSAQFQLARAYMEAINDPGEVRIQGPTFSGSFPSLTNLLRYDKALYRGRSYRVRSGTVSSSAAGEAFQQQFPDFHGATANSKDQAKYFSLALQDMRIPEKYAALLAEDESSAGEAAVQAASDIKVFRFPRDISHLRNAYREAVQSSKSENAPAPDIDFSLKDPTTGEDSIPIFSSTQTPLSQNGVLNEITSAIRREGIQIVRVNASNVLDLLFLAEVLKQRCPDTRLIVEFPDVLFAQAAQAGKLAGTLALSSYPMFYANNQWMGNFQSKQPQFFSDANSEGVYNATLLLLSARLGPYRASYGFLNVSDYNWKKLLHPPTWILMLDRQGFLPVNVLPHTPEQEITEKWFQKVTVAGTSLRPQLPSPSGLWSFVSTTLALAGVLISIWIFAVTLGPTLQVDARLTLTEIDSEGDGRSFFLFLFLILLASMLMVMWSPLLAPNQGFSLSLFLPGLVAGALLMAPALFLLWSGACCAGANGAKMLFGLLALGGALCLWLTSCSDGSDRSLFFALRATELRVGSCPAWPILAALAALLAFSFVHLTRFYLSACQKPEVLTEDIETPLQPRLYDAFDNFNASLESPVGLWKRKHWIWFAGILVLAGLLCLVGRIDVKLRSVEGRPYDFLVAGLQLLVVLTLLVACWHAMQLWRSFQSFLSCLGILPLATSFIRTDRSASNRPIWVRRLNLQSIDIHARCLVALHDMQLLRKNERTAPVAPLAPSWELESWIQTYMDRLKHGLLQVDPPQTRDQALEAAREIRRLHKKIATEMFKLARYQWMHKPLSARMLGPQLASAAASGDKAAELPDRGHGDKLGDLAQTFLALHYSAFILYGIRQIQYLVGFLSVGFVLLVISTSSYSFQAPEFIGRLLLALFAVTMWVVWTCLSGMERDPIISRIGGTDPGKLNSDFYFKLLSYGGLPLLGLLASEFPAVSNFLFFWVQPALEKFR